MRSVNSPKLDDSVLSYVQRDFPRLLVQQTVGEALNWLRVHPPEGQIIYFYVVDSENLLHGVVPTRRLLLEPYDRPVSEVLVRSVVSISDRSTVREACEGFAKHRLLALPVIDGGGKMLGLVDISLFTNTVSELGAPLNSDDLFQRIGVHLSGAQTDSALSGFRSRFPWLGCNLGAGILAAFLSGVYQNELSRVVALAFFIPVVLNLAESVSSQSVSLALELMRGQVPTWNLMLEKLRRESLTGLLLGLGSGTIVGLVALAWLGQPRVMACLIGGVTGGVTGAAILGLVMPYALRLLRLDPQVAAGPIALAGADIVTLLLYLNLARRLL